MRKDLDQREKSLLGTILYNGSIPESWNKISSAYFSNPKHQIIASYINILSYENKQINIVNLNSRLNEDSKAEKAGGIAYISSLTDDKTVRLDDLNEYYIKPIIDDYRKRKLAETLADASNSLKDNSKSFSEITEDIEKRISECSGLNQTKTKTMQDLMEAEEKETVSIGLDPGVKQLLRLDKGELTIIGARPSIGKTSLMIRMMLNIAKSHNVGFLSLETTTGIIYKKLVAALSGVSVNTQREKTYNEKKEIKSKIAGKEYTSYINELEEVKKARKELLNYKLFINSELKHDIDSVKSEIRNLVINKHCEIIFIDYLGLITCSGSGEYEITTKVSKEISSLCKSLNVPFVVASQLRRPTDRKETDKEPELTDLRQSGQIEQDADNIYLLHGKRENDKSGNSDRKIIIAKNRNGDKGDKAYKYIFNGLRCTFEFIDIEKKESGKEENKAEPETDSNVESEQETYIDLNQFKRNRK